MDSKTLNNIKARAEEAKRMLAEVTDEISTIDRQIADLNIQCRAIEVLPKHFDEWVAECVQNSLNLADSFSGWGAQLLKQQEPAGWRAGGGTTNPAGNFMPHDGFLSAPVTQAALLSLMGPEIVEAGLRRMAADHWPKDCLTQAEKDKRLSALTVQISALSERRDALAACLPG